MKVTSVRKVSRQKPCIKCGKMCYGSYEAVLETGGSLPLCSECYNLIEQELAEGQAVDIPLKSARF